jgi:hypothetical protein
MKKLLLLALLFGTTLAHAQQPCATIGFQSNPNTNTGNLLYADNFFGDTANTVFTWTLCNGVTATGISVSVPPSGGLMNACVVCLEVTDAITNNTLCTVCDSVYLGGNPPNPCAAYATYTNVDSFYTFFASTTGNAPVQYEWYVNNVLYDTAASFSLVVDSTNNVNGGTSVCVNILDVSGCTASDCILLGNNSNPSGGGNVPCQAYFVIYGPDSTNSGNPNGGLPGYYWGYNLSAGNYGSDILWDFGDGTTSSDPYPVHTYANPGTYIVCLTVGVAGTNCYDTYCDSSFYVFKTEGQPMSQLSILAPTGINETAATTALRVFPNPVSNELNWATGNGVEQVRIYNTNGQKVMEAANHTGKLNLSTLAPGIYFIQLASATGKTISAQRFVKQ